MEQEQSISSKSRSSCQIQSKISCGLSSDQDFGGQSRFFLAVSVRSVIKGPGAVVAPTELTTHRRMKVIHSLSENNKYLRVCSLELHIPMSV